MMLRDLSSLLRTDRLTEPRRILKSNQTLELLYKAYDSTQQRSRIHINRSQTVSDSYIHLQKTIIDLQLENDILKRDIERKDIHITKVEKENNCLQTELSEARQQILYLNNISEAQAENIKDLHQSRDSLAKQLEQMTIQSNRQMESIRQQSLRLAQQLNEVNDLQEQLLKKRDLINDEASRIDKKYKDLENSQIFLQSSPKRDVPTSLTQYQYRSQGLPNIVQRKLTNHHLAEIYDLTINLNGTLIATCGGDHYVRIYNPLKDVIVTQNQASRQELYTSIRFSPNNDYLLMGSTNHSAQLWQIDGGWRLKQKFMGHIDQVNAVDFLTTQRDVCVTGSNDRCLKLWSLPKGTCIQSMNSGSMVQTLACLHSQPQVITGHKDGSLRGYAMKGDPKPTFHQQNLFNGGITSITLNQDNNAALVCSKEGTVIKLFDLRMNKVFKSWNIQVSKSYTHNSYMNGQDHHKACFGPSEDFVIAGNSNAQILSWNTEDSSFHSILKQGGHDGIVLRVEYHNVSGQLYSADSKGNLIRWS